MRNYCISYIYSIGPNSGKGFRIITAKNIREANDILTADQREGESIAITSVYSEPIPGPSGYIS